MPTLNSTTLSASLSATDRFPQLTSTASIAVGDYLVIDREAMAVVALAPLRVMRGVRGAAVKHVAGATVYSGTPSRFATVDPVGVPDADVVTPWINLRTGDVWVAQGSSAGPGTNSRYWTKQTITRSTGALGVVTVTTTP